MNLHISKLQTRIAVVFAALLALILGTAFFIVDAATSREVTATVKDQVHLGVGIVERTLEQNRIRLQQAANVLSSDFGFRDAIASHDTASIDSVLGNHATRIGAHAMMLISLEHKVIADTLRPKERNRTFELPALLSQAEQSGEASALVAVNGRLYQFVIVPVLAPDPIAWTAMGFLVDDAVAKDLSKLSGLEVSFLERSGESLSQLLASTFTGDRRTQLLGAANASSATTIDLGDERFATRLLKLNQSQDSTTVALLQRSLTKAFEPHNRLRRTLGLLSLVSLLVCIGGSFLLARKITRPINALAAVAKRIEGGDYSARAEENQGDEIGQLAATFNHMGTSIADREKEILRLAYEDALTGLPNRAMFNDRLSQAVRLCNRTMVPFSVMMMDLDRFKYINDSLGHQVGDEVLIEVSKRLRSLLRESDTLARLGGDEFVMLLPTGNPEEIVVLVKRIVAALEVPIVLEGQPLDVAVSMGIAHYPEHAGDAVSLLQRADIAMYAAKQKRSQFVIYDPALEGPRENYLSLLGELRRAIEQNEFRLYYQAKVDVKSGSIIGAEALVRWIHPTRGFMPPTEFIPFAEQTGFIRTITTWVIANAIAQCATWKAMGHRISMSINISARDLLNADLPRQIEEVLAQHHLEPELICLEITESALMEDPGHALENVGHLRAIGLRLSIDDYGTGYSSLAYIRNLHVHELKIDQTFVRGIATDQRNVAIVRSAIDLAHNLGLTVSAEGVEEAGELDLLRTWGCDEAQGYHINGPQPAEKLEAMFKLAMQPPSCTTT